MKTRENMQMIKLDVFPFWCMVIPLGPRSVYSNEGPKGFVN